MMNSNRLGCYCTAGKTNFERYFVMQIFVQNWFFFIFYRKRIRPVDEYEN